MEYTATDKGIVLIQPDFNLAETLDCGQAFRWSENSDGSYSGFFLDNFLHISEESEGRFLFHGVSEEQFTDVWKKYFDLETDYGELKKRFSEDRILADACRFAPGIRLLRQDPWESLCSFIISQNNNIPRIKGIINRLCEKYGRFPGAEDLSSETPETLGWLRAGFRAKYIADASERVASGKTDLAVVSSMPYDDAKKELMKIKGVGPKVADCVLLFGMHRTEAFPVDVWIRRVMAAFYPDGMPECTKGFEGTAQQYLFHYVRSHPEMLED